MFNTSLVTHSPDPERSRYFFLGYLKDNLTYSFTDSNINYLFIRKPPSLYIDDFRNHEVDAEERIEFKTVLKVNRMPTVVYSIGKSYTDGQKIFKNLVDLGYARPDFKTTSSNEVEEFNQYIESVLRDGKEGELMADISANYSALKYFIYMLGNRL